MGSLGETKSAVDHALTLAPDELSVRLALGYYYYYGLSDFERALEVFQAVVRDRPNDADALEARAWIERRLGRWNDFFATFDRVLELDPGAAALIFEVGDTFVALRQFDSAVEYYESAIALVPDMREAWQGLLKVELYGMGSIDGAREIADRWPGEDPSRYLDISRLERDRAGYLAAAEALAPSDRIARLVKYAHIGTAREWLGDMGEAIRAAEAMVSFSPEDRFGGPVWKENRALLYTRAGEVERAIDLLEGLLETPYLGPSLAGFPITRRSLRMGPEWDPLREHPRFQSLISE